MSHFVTVCGAVGPREMSLAVLRAIEGLRELWGCVRGRGVRVKEVVER